MTYQSSWTFSMESKNKFLPTYYSSHNVMTLPWCIIVDPVLIFYIAIKLFVTLIPAMEISLPTKWGKCLYTCAQSCPMPGYPMDHSPPGSVVYGIFRAKILQWVRSSPSRDRTCISCIGKWILYCCAKSNPICPVLAIARVQLPSLEFGRDSKAGKTWESFIVKKREVFTKIGGCWNNGKCTISFSPNFFFPPELKARGKT